LAKFTFFDGNLGFYGYGDLVAYVVPEVDGTQMVLDYDLTQGPWTTPSTLRASPSPLPPSPAIPSKTGHMRARCG
jgi:hypothetical protein